MNIENTQLATLPQAAIARQVDAPLWNSLKEMFDGASDQSIGLVLDYCKARKLDPLKKPVHIVPVWSNRRKCMVETVWPSISEIRTTAARTGLFAGQDETKFGPVLKQDLGNAKGFEFPEWAQVTVYRMVAGQRCAFVGPKVYFLESYATAKRDSHEPNAMWSKRTWGQLEKCAEAAALRRAFPEETGLTADEMAGKTLDEHELVNVTGTADTTATGETSEANKRPAIPRKSRGAAALQAETTTATATDVTVAADTSSAGVSTEKPAEKVAEKVETKAESPKAESKPETPKPEAAKDEGAPKSFWPHTIRAKIGEHKVAGVKNNPKYDKCTVVLLAGSPIKMPGGMVALPDLGKMIIDPEQPALAAFAEDHEREFDFLVVEQPSASNPEKKNKVITKITPVAAEETVDV